MTRLLIATIILILGFNNVSAQTSSIVEGTHYTKLSAPLNTSSNGKIEVREFFWYSSPQSYQLQVDINNWLQRAPNDVAFVRTPVILQQNMSSQALAYYVAEALGILDNTHPKMYNAIHNGRKKLTSLTEIISLFSQLGISANTFNSSSQSPLVKSKVQQGQALFQSARGKSAPTFIVNGLYKVELNSSVKQNTMLKIVAHLIAKIKSEKMK